MSLRDREIILAHAANEENGVFIHIQSRVIDVSVIVFWPIKHDGLGFKGIWVFWVRKIALAEFIRDHAGFHNGGVK